MTEEQRAFEEWAKDWLYDLSKDERGYYVASVTWAAWHGWRRPEPPEGWKL